MWQVAVYTEHQHDQFLATNRRFELRKPAGEITWQLYETAPAAMADGDADAIDMRVDSTSLLIDCRGMDQTFELSDGSSFSTDVPVQAPLPVMFRVGEAWIEVRPAVPLANLDLQPLSSGKKEPAAQAPVASRGPDGETVAKWLAAAGQLHRLAASSPTFFDAAAQIALDCTGLNAAFVLTPNDGQWTIAGSAIQQPEHGISFEYRAVELVCEQPDVWRRLPQVVVDANASSIEGSNESIVVAPVRGDAGSIVAVVYGVRHNRSDNRRRGIRTLEARVIESIAEAVSVGIARRQQEVEAARQRVCWSTHSPPQSSNTCIDIRRRSPRRCAKLLSSSQTCEILRASPNDCLQTTLANWWRRSWNC
jgi:hypothetical protein